MAQQVRIENNSAGWRALLLSSGVRDLVETTANEITAKANAIAPSVGKDRDAPKYITKGPKAGQYGGGRYIAYVAADNSEALIAESRHKVLEKACGGR